jgi:hypothetical protein
MTDHQPVSLWDTHLITPAEMDVRARSFYDDLRLANPWLPDPDHVSAGRDLEVTFGVDSFSTLTLTVHIVLPEGVTP